MTTSSAKVDDNIVHNGPSVIDARFNEEDIAHLTGHASVDETTPELTLGRYTFKLADRPEEFEQIHRLNHRTFVEEVGQYPDTGTETLVDKFHDKNRYFIAIAEGRVIGMVATHDSPPFSLTKRLPDPSFIETLGNRVIELRLLAIDPAHRNSQVFHGLLWFMYEFSLSNGYQYLVISGIAGRTRLYERMGFRALGPAVPDGDASFIPMMVNLHEMPENIKRDARRMRTRLVEEIAERQHEVISLLPGPVHIASEIRQAMAVRPVSHRGEDFVRKHEWIRQVLSEMAGGLGCAIFAGSGTLANEVVAATIRADTGLRRGLILNNGEFGRRLGAQAARHGLDFETLCWPWGTKWDIDAIRDTLEQDPSIDWIWATHCETSVSLMNNLDALFELAAQYDAKVCLDCVSSFGAVSCDLTRAHLATAVSGKALGAIPGLAFVFAGEEAMTNVDHDRLPQYLDLATAMSTVGPRWTVSSNVLDSLEMAIRLWYDTPEKRRKKFDNHVALGEYVRRRLKSLGFTPLIDDDDAAPCITSFTPPQELSSRAFCELCESWGFEISGLSGYLLERGIVQIATMGAVSRRDCARLFAQLQHWMTSREST